MEVFLSLVAWIAYILAFFTSLFAIGSHVSTMQLILGALYGVVAVTANVGASILGYLKKKFSVVAAPPTDGGLAGDL